MREIIIISAVFIICLTLFNGILAYETAEEGLVLCGTGKRTMSIIGSVYTSSLYTVPELKGASGKLIIETDEPSAVIMNITSRLITRKKFLKAVEKGFEKAKASGYKTEEDLKFLSLFDGIEIHKGDEIRLCYIPGEGLNASLRSGATGETKNLGTIPGHGFKQSLYAIWLGPDPVQDRLKKGMLGQE